MSVDVTTEFITCLPNELKHHSNLINNIEFDASQDLIFKFNGGDEFLKYQLASNMVKGFKLNEKNDILENWKNIKII